MQTKKLRQDRAKYAAKLHTAQNEIKRLLFYVRKLTSSLSQGDKKYREIADSVATGADDDLSHVDRENEPLELRLQASENKVFDLKSKLRSTEEMVAVLTQRCDGFAMNLKAASAESRRSQDDLIRLKENYSHSALSAQAKTHRQENSVLRKQAMHMRAEVLRLQADVGELGRFAIGAVEALAGAAGVAGQGTHLAVDANQLSDTLANLRDKFSYLASSSSSSALLPQETDSGASSPPPAHSPSSYESRLLSANGVTVTASAPPGNLKSPPTAPLSTSSRGNTISGAEPLSVIAQDRLLRNIYCHYIGDSLGYMNLTRFARFGKEFDLVGNQADRLISGELDIIFHNSRKVVPVGEAPVLAPSRAFGVRAGAEAAANRSVSGSPLRSKAAAAGTYHRSMSYAALSPGQFIFAVQTVASRIYADLIESQIGAALDCLPPKQKAAAAKAAMDVLISKRLIPTSRELGMMENMPVIHLDEALKAIHASPDRVSPLTAHEQQMKGWFGSYASPRLESGSMRYKSLSSFAHDFGIVPYLLREPQLYHIFQEVLLWYNVDPLSFNQPLPTDMAAVPLEIKNNPVEQKMRPLTADAAEARRALNLRCFEMILAAAAMQAYPDLEAGARIAKLFEWAATAVGSN